MKSNDDFISIDKKSSFTIFHSTSFNPYDLATMSRFFLQFSKFICSYLAPEYFQHGKVSDKTDVYAVGVVLLELITGRKPFEARAHGEENLVLWVGHYITLIILFSLV